jgi:hypothetical protein
MRAAHPGTNMFVKLWIWKRGRAADQQEELATSKTLMVASVSKLLFFPRRRPASNVHPAACVDTEPDRSYYAYTLPNRTLTKLLLAAC